MEMMIKKSNIYALEITNSNPAAYNVKNVFYLKFINNTNFEVEVSDRFFGKLKIAPNIPVDIVGFPQYPYDVAFTTKFNAAAPATDSITVITNSIG